MVKDLAKYAASKGIKYFMVSYTDLFGGQRAKLVPAQAINDMAVDGAGFAGFATWLDLTAAHPDMMAVPDASSVIQLPWKPEVAWLASNCVSRLSCLVGGRQSESSQYPASSLEQVPPSP